MGDKEERVCIIIIIIYPIQLEPLLFPNRWDSRRRYWKGEASSSSSSNLPPGFLIGNGPGAYNTTDRTRPYCGRRHM
ncbi:hypothetical protein L6452_43353 [Arctium lappa]|uniref:Uncharacterized protein n=1 Tax=Arctium lappa TaxID=4217 RepID=A0ACB8XKQ7_ARCLA|nr:hypothetical protein L6452_43353 [Arctium lappa]